MLFIPASKSVMFSKSLEPLLFSSRKLVKVNSPVLEINALARTRTKGRKTSKTLVIRTKKTAGLSLLSKLAALEAIGSKLSGLVPPQRLAVKAAKQKAICNRANAAPCCKSSLCRTDTEIAVSKVFTLPPPRLSTIP